MCRGTGAISVNSNMPGVALTTLPTVIPLQESSSRFGVRGAGFGNRPLTATFGRAQVLKEFSRATASGLLQIAGDFSS